MIDFLLQKCYNTIIMASNEKLILLNDTIQDKIEHPGALFRFKRMAYHAIVGVVIGGSVVHFAPQVHPDALAEMNNETKPYGPYSFEHEPGPVEQAEAVPAYGSDALILSDDFDGLLATSGYGVYVDFAKMSEDLALNEYALVTQEVVSSDGEHQVSGSIYANMNNEANIDEDNQNISAFVVNDAGIKVPLYEFYSRDVAGHDNSIQENGLSNSYVPINGGGVVLHSNEPSKITIDTYEINENEPPFLVSEKTAEVEIVENVDCGDLAEAVTTEVIMMPDERDTICEALREYSALLPDDYKVRLDTVNVSSLTHDSVDLQSRTVQLTYPFIKRELVDENDLRATVLHEIMHAAYRDQITKNILYLNHLNHVYQGVRNESEFQIPTLEDQRNGIGPLVGEVEDIWGIITESTYVQNTSANGHAWDSATEMISSTAAVMANYPVDFVERYKKLDAGQQEAIKEAAFATFDLIERYDVPADSVVRAQKYIEKELGW